MCDFDVRVVELPGPQHVVQLCLLPSSTVRCVMAERAPQPWVRGRDGRPSVDDSQRHLAPTGLLERRAQHNGVTVGHVDTDDDVLECALRNGTDYRNIAVGMSADMLADGSKEHPGE